MLNGRPHFAGKRYHFIGCGGVGMSGLAKILIGNQAVITGSDQTHSAVIDSLNALGAKIHIGHISDNIADDVDAVVISAAVKEDNPELQAARKKGLKVYKYAQMLGEIMHCYSGIAICGTHGKSTTTGWLTMLLKRAGLDPNFVVGAEIAQLGESSGGGSGKYFIVEACEYDRSFLNLQPKIGVMLNIEADHLDYYKDVDEIVEAFCDFACGIRQGGVLIANGQDENVKKVISRLDKSVCCQTFGLEPQFDCYADNLTQVGGYYEFDVYYGGKRVGRTRASVPGKHNVFNALAVISAAICAGVEPKAVLELLGEFEGMDRRVMLKAKLDGITVLDDYAHHPTEIRASLSAVRERYSPKRLFCVFQPHQYSRTRFLLDDFAESFKLADVTIVPDIYFVRDTEAEKKQVNSQVLVDKIRENGSDAVFIDSFKGIVKYLKNNILAGDVIVTMGAGDIWKVADEYIRWLGKDR